MVKARLLLVSLVLPLSGTLAMIEPFSRPDSLFADSVSSESAQGEENVYVVGSKQFNYKPVVYDSIDTSVLQNNTFSDIRDFYISGKSYVSVRPFTIGRTFFYPVNSQSNWANSREQTAGSYGDFSFTISWSIAYNVSTDKFFYVSNWTDKSSSYKTGYLMSVTSLDLRPINDATIPLLTKSGQKSYTKHNGPLFSPMLNISFSAYEFSPSSLTSTVWDYRINSYFGYSSIIINGETYANENYSEGYSAGYGAGLSNSSGQYSAGYSAGYGNGQKNPTTLSWFEGASTVVLKFLDIPIMGSFTLAGLIGGIVIVLIFKWILGWFI